MISALGAVVARAKGVRFPEQRLGGWWWRGRWRLEFALGWLEPESVEWVESVAKPGMTVIDVGAHIGYYTRLLSDLVGPSGRVYAFEPHPDNLEFLRHNTRKLGNVEVLGAAVSDRVGSVTLHVSAGHSNHSLIDGYTEEEGRIEVESVALDAFAADKGIAEIGLVKVDVEGAEPLVMEGMTGLMKSKRVGALLLEFNAPALLQGGVEPASFIRSLIVSGLQLVGSDGRELSVSDPIPDRVVNLFCRPAE